MRTSAHSHHLPPPPNPLPLPPPPNPNVFSSPSSSTPLLPTPPKPPPFPFRRLTPAELASRRERGLCFHCDEKFTRGHRCASRFFLLVADEDDPNALPDPSILPSCASPLILFFFGVCILLFWGFEHQKPNHSFVV